MINMLDNLYIHVTKPGRYYVLRDMDPNIHIVDIDNSYFTPIPVIDLLKEPSVRREDLLEE